MNRCPRCNVTYADDVRFCPSDGQPLAAGARTDDLVGQLIADRYQVVARLGEGGMGQVFLADHVKMGRRSAIKVLGRGLMNDPESVSRFNREAANASRISHPNVCAVYDFGETADGRLYLAMEYVEGRTLQQLLHEEGPLPLPRAALIVEQIAAALSAAHAIGIVHRDLKPDNVMVTSAQGRDTVKVVDFGIAKAAGVGDQQVTRTGFVIGTPDYMSPEQLAGDEVDARTDIYALGLVFFRTLTGALPFEGATGQDSLVKRLTQPPRRLAEASPGSSFPAALQAVLDRALARQPAERYATAPDFARAISRVVEAGRRLPGIPGSVITPSAAAPAVRPPFSSRAARRESRRSAPRGLVAALVVLALAAGGAYYAHAEGMLPAWPLQATRGAAASVAAAEHASDSEASSAAVEPDSNGAGAPDAGVATHGSAPTSGAVTTNAAATSQPAVPARPAASREPAAPSREPAAAPAAPRPSGGVPTLGRPVGDLVEADERPDPAAVAALAASTATPDSTLDETGHAARALSVMRDSLHVARLRPAIRARSALLAGQPTLSDSVRAEAAVLVARVAYADLRYGAAREWLLRALRLFPREEYRDMLDQLPDGGTP